jgi:ketopantoate hydroxymethyltransferase
LEVTNQILKKLCVHQYYESGGHAVKLEGGKEIKDQLKKY